jgi:hypothetical protein
MRKLTTFRLLGLTTLTLCLCLSWAASAHADAVSDWNAIAVQSILATPTHPGATGVLDLATVQAAVYDAVQAIERRYQPYHVRIHGASGSPAAAAAKAAHDVLVNRFPALTASLDMTYHTYLAANGLAEDDPGVAVGQQAAAGIIAFRANDGSFPASFPPFTGGTGIGVWRPTESFLPGPPPSFSPMLAPWMATVTPFTLRRPSQFRAPRPPAVTSEKYTKAYNEVKNLGVLSNGTRNADQTELALFWNLNYVLVWNKVARDLAAAQLLDIADSARLFALADMAMADAILTAWDTKLHYVFWRPLTAIREGDNDGNPDTAGDPAWQPLLNNPNYPDYTSGANNITAAATRSLRLFFRTNNLTFSVTTTNPAAMQQTRTYHHFSDAVADVVNARIYEGIHFRFADVEARRQGRSVALWAFSHFFKPVDDDDHHHHHHGKH